MTVSIGPLVRRKGGPSPEQMKSDPAFKRTRENGKEFGNCGKATKLLRRVLMPLLKEASDHLVTGRLNKLMFAIKNLDNTSARGERNVATGIATPAAKDLIKGFDFNANAPLERVLKKQATVNTSAGVITIGGLVPQHDLDWPAGASHARLTGGWLKIDFGAENAELAGTNQTVVQKNNSPANVVLAPVAVPGGIGNDVFVLQLVFYQEVNGVQYVLKNGEFNAMAVIEMR